MYCVHMQLGYLVNLHKFRVPAMNQLHQLCEKEPMKIGAFRGFEQPGNCFFQLPKAIQHGMTVSCAGALSLLLQPSPTLLIQNVKCR